jgi:hypothetical protein
MSCDDALSLSLSLSALCSLLSLEYNRQPTAQRTAAQLTTYHNSQHTIYNSRTSVIYTPNLTGLLTLFLTTFTVCKATFHGPYKISTLKSETLKSKIVFDFNVEIL